MKTPIKPSQRITNLAMSKKHNSTKEANRDLPPIPTQLTKEIEDLLVQTNVEKVAEVVRNSNGIHEMVESVGIDKSRIVEWLYDDPLFRYSLACLLFNMKVFSKKRLEDYVYQRIKQKIREEQTKAELEARIGNINNRISQRMERLEAVKRNFSI